MSTFPAFAPGIPELMREFNSAHETIASFVVSAYALGHAIGPLIITPLSELYGRLAVKQKLPALEGNGMCGLNYVDDSWAAASMRKYKVQSLT